jgi:hypothetical protein
MFIFAVHARSRDELMEALHEAVIDCQDDDATGGVEEAATALLGPMGKEPKGGSILISVQADVILGGYTVNRSVSVAYHPEDMTKGGLKPLQDEPLLKDEAKPKVAVVVPAKTAAKRKPKAKK